MLLEYALLTAPEPLQAGTTANLTLTISNGGRQFVTVTKIVITLPLGTDAKDLSSSSTFQTSATSGWNLAQSGGALTLTPTGSGAVTTNAVTVTIANVAVNDQPGTANILIDETAAIGSGTPATSSTSLPAAKFPVQFSLSDLVATPPQVAFGGSSSLMWSGTQAGNATYTLQYPGVAPIPVANVGPYHAANLTIFPAVFTLTVSLTVPGQDQPLIVQKQATVNEIPQVAITQFVGSQSVMAGADPPLTLQWQVQLASSVTLSLENVAGSVDVTNLSGCTVSANGSWPLVISDPSGKQIGTLQPPNPFPSSGFLTFVLTASGGNLVAQQPFQIQVLTPAQVTHFDCKWTIELSEGLLTKGLFLSWGTANANPVTISNIGTVAASGFQEISPGQTFTIQALGFGTQATQQLFVNG